MIREGCKAISFTAIRYCIKCDELFKPDGKRQKVCFNCSPRSGKYYLKEQRLEVIA